MKEKKPRRLFPVPGQKNRKKARPADDVKIYAGSGAETKDAQDSAGSPGNAPKRRPGRRGRPRRKTWVRVLQITLVVLLALTLGVTAYAARYVSGLSRDLPDWDSTDMIGDLTTTFYDADGEVIAERHGVENRTPVSFDAVPEHFKEAFLATEDASFYRHFGVSIPGIVRSAIANLRAGRITQGASTITQQLARNALLDADVRYQRQWDRKIREMLLALQIENQYEKDEIFEMYLNTISFGQGAYGVQAAAQTFFGKDVGDLTLEESALLAGLPQRPSGHNPFRYPENALNRRSVVLRSMESEGYITAEERARADSAPLELAPPPVDIVEGSYLFFIDHAMTEAEAILEEIGYSPDIYRNGYHIYTTMHRTGQTALEELFADPDNFPPDRSEEKVQAALIVIDHRTGEIQAMMGGREYLSQRGFNRATSPQMKRQPGSAFKPVAVYGPALEYGGMSPATVIDDIPVTIDTPQGPYEPANYDHRYRGLITMREAIRSSVNIPAVKTLAEIGTETGYNFCTNLGIPLQPEERHNLSIALGGLSYGCNPLELAAAFGAFANEGILAESHAVTRIATNNGTVIYEARPQQKVVMSEETAFLMNDMLRTVVSSGTGYGARIPGWETAGKTGTTQLPSATAAERAMFAGIRGNRDAWFVGYTPRYTASVWMGFDITTREHYLPQVYGGSYPAQLFRNVLIEMHDGLEPESFRRPAGIVSIAVDRKSGLLPSELTPSDFISRDFFRTEHIPTEVSEAWTTAIICTDTGQLATYLCPGTESRVFLQRDTTYRPTVPIRDIQRAFERNRVRRVDDLPASVIENLVKTILPEDYALTAPTEYCALHYRTGPEGPGEDNGTGAPAVNPVLWEFFPEAYRPAGYVPPSERPDDADPLDPMVPPGPGEPADPMDPDDAEGDEIFASFDLLPHTVGIKLEWSLAEQYHGPSWEYILWKQGPEDPEPTQLVALSDTQYIDEHTEPDTLYTYTVYARHKPTGKVYSSGPRDISY